MNYNESLCIIEALLFASGEPISLDRLSEASGIEPETVIREVMLDRQPSRQFATVEQIGVSSVTSCVV